MTYTTLELTRRDGAAWITLDRPKRLNALTGEMYRELERAAAECEADPEVGAIVLTGRGRAFCAGADLKSYTTVVDVTDPHSVRFEEEVAEYARRVSATPARAAEMILTGLRHAPLMDLDTTLEWEANAIAMVLSTPEARAAFRPKEAV
jgi:enoyl-CoA hydratase/carnithine racemase